MSRQLQKKHRESDIIYNTLQH